MIENIQASTATPTAATSDATSKDSQGGGGAPQSAPVASTSSGDSSDAAPPVTPAKPTTRLLIDQDKVTGVYVYRIVDSGSGRLLAEIPNDQIANLKDADDYVSGSVISTSV
jgi:myo-inositol-hexaphosphate 3-phosphohydrolase